MLNPSPGPQRLYLSLNGIEPYDDSGLDFTYFMEPEMSNFVGVSPGGGPAAGGTPVTVLASGLDALGTFAPPATGAARCRWGHWDPQVKKLAAVQAALRTARVWVDRRDVALAYAVTDEDGFPR